MMSGIPECPRDLEAAMALAARELAARADLEAEDLRYFSAGLEFLVCRGRLRGVGEIVVRFPWVRWIHNDNDVDLDARDLLRQEAELLQFARSVGIPAPRVVKLSLGDACDFLVTEYLEHDDSEPDPRELGEILARLHGAAAPVRAPVLHFGQSTDEVLAQRLRHRADVCERLGGVRLGLPDAARMRAELRSFPARRRLLHMDFRRANILAREGRVAGVIDWSNALTGDPALEVCRIAEFREQPAGLTDGYGGAAAWPVAPPVVDLLYRLDTAVMLGVVFLSEAPDAGKAAVQLARIDELAFELNWRMPR